MNKEQISININISQQTNQRYKTIRHTPKKGTRQAKEDFNTIKSQKLGLPQTQIKKQKMELLKKKAIIILNFPSQFQAVQSHYEQCNRSDWKKRINLINKVKDLALQNKNQFMQYRSANHFIDIICKQIIELNIKVSINAMNVFLQILQPQRSLVQNNLSILCNSIFNCLSRNKQQIKQKSQQLAQYVFQSIQMSNILLYVSHGIFYSLPKSRVYLLNKLKGLKGKIEQFMKKKKNDYCLNMFFH